jgi:hypothetical protein
MPGRAAAQSGCKGRPGHPSFFAKFLKRWIAGSTLAIALSDRSPGNYGLVLPFELVAREATPSFFCRLVDEVVYWKVSFLPGKT